ncbi:MAG: DNA-3-methyladenine glycosylase [Chloroflexi bacterium]|nr:DNA-3-methyladenine glycosylase [Chloroflexota bacterium]
MPPPLPTRFFDRHPLTVAHELLGCEVWVRADDAGKAQRGRIVETEAYGGFDDRACHGHRGETPRMRSLFGPPGRALVYLTYGVHHMLNAVALGPGEPYCVLIRALEPVANLSGDTRGPGLLTKALGVDLSYDGAHLRRGALRMLAGAPRTDESIAVSTRVGVEGAGPEDAGRPWRFYLADNPYVSRGRPSSVERAARVVAERAVRSTLRSNRRGGSS